MDVIGAGFGRTGTLSLHTALEQLGFGPCHHMFNMFLDLDQIPRWRTALTAEPLDVRHVYEHYRSTVDFPGSYYWRELHEAWPEAKVVLTVRDPERWYASARDTIFKAQQQELPPEVTDPDMIETQAFVFGELVPRVMDIGDGRRLDQVGEKEAVEAFERHNAEVQATVPAGQLLVYQVSEGWGPLCDFLDVPVPDQEFPQVNESGNFEQQAQGLWAERARRLAAN